MKIYFVVSLLKLCITDLLNLYKSFICDIMDEH